MAHTVAVARCQESAAEQFTRPLAFMVAQWSGPSTSRAFGNDDKKAV